MERVAQREPLGVIRALLLTLGAVGVLVVLGLLFGARPASADEGAPPPSVSGGSLLDVVGGVVGQAAGTATDQVAVVQDAVSGAVTPVANALPAPVQAAAASVTPVVAQIVQSVPAPATQVVGAVTGAADSLVASVPLVGSAVGQVGSVTVPVTTAVAGIAHGAAGIVSGAAVPPVPSSGTGEAQIGGYFDGVAGRELGR